MPSSRPNNLLVYQTIIAGIAMILSGIGTGLVTVYYACFVYRDQEILPLLGVSGAMASIIMVRMGILAFR